MGLSGKTIIKTNPNGIFIKNGITLKYNNFLHPVYPQIGGQKFIEGLSIIDALFNVGRDQVMEWVHSK